MKSALVVVDLQVDFLCKEGKTPVVGAEKLLKPINRLIDTFAKNGHYVVFVKDSHPAHHVSFRTQGEHCLANSEGALLHRDLHLPVGKSIILSKGSDRREDVLSAFGATDGFFSLDHFLEDWGVSNLFVAGVGLDGCVGQTALEAVGKNFNSYVVTDASKARTSSGYKQYLEELPKMGVRLEMAKNIPKLVKRTKVLHV